MAETTTIARPYARAAFEAAQTEEGGLARWSQMLELIAGVAQQPEMYAVLTSPEQDSDFKAGLFLEFCGDRLPPAGSNFIKLLAENQRLDILPQIHEVYEILRAEAEKTVEAEVISAFEISEEQRHSITAALSKRLNRDVILNCTIDETLIGGAIIRAGDLVIDGSARGKLHQLAAQLRQ